jgi:predicted nucleic acid-binding protein
VTGSWTRIEVSGALIRAARRDRRVDVDALLASLDADLAAEGFITVVGAAANDVETRALELVRKHGLRTLDAWHLATAQLTVQKLAAPGEPVAFATRDEEQGAVAESLGFARA